VDLEKLTASLEQADRLLRQGALQDAEALYREILDDTPGQPNASQGLGLIALHTGHASAAVELLQMASIGLPEDATIHTNLGLAFATARDARSAEECYRKAIALTNDFADAHLNLANLLLESKRIDEAAVEYEAAESIAPDSGAVHYGMAMLELGRGRSGTAITAFEKALTFAPELLPARVNLATLLYRKGDHEEAVSQLEEAVSFAPDSFDARLNLCAMLQQTDRTSDAVDIARGTLALAPESPELLLNLSSAETANGHPEDAWRTLDRALGVAPDYAPAKLNRAMVRLLLGDMPGGWEDFEARPSRGILPNQSVAKIPMWNGEDLSDRSIIVWAEQGYGDVIQFARFLPRLKELGARVFLHVPPALERLFSGIPTLAGILVRDRDGDTPIADFQLPILSIMNRLNIGLKDVELTKDFTSTSTRGIELSVEGDKPIIGLCWQGSETNPNDHRRSISPAALLDRLAGANFQFIGLQFGILDAPLDNPGKDVKDFAEMASLILQTDLVISVDTSVAHLAGTLKKPVWTMLSYAPDWRWQTEREDSPWYPTMRLFRQPAPGDWNGVFDQVAAALGEYTL
jgi:tetratricopeptide (TPR) repeat protein